jgi:copper chaperone CopZ
MEEITLKVSGMHCPSCEMLVSDELGEIGGVKTVQASHKEGTVKVKYEGKIDLAKVRKSISDLGYTVKD